jgi:hypothetical protein
MSVPGETGPAALTTEHWGAVCQALSVEIARVRSLELGPDSGLRLLEEAYAVLAAERERRLEAAACVEGEVLYETRHPGPGYLHDHPHPVLRLVASRVDTHLESLAVEVEDGGMAARVVVAFPLLHDAAGGVAAALERWLGRPGAGQPPVRVRRGE